MPIWFSPLARKGKGCRNFNLLKFRYDKIWETPSKAQPCSSNGVNGRGHRLTAGEIEQKRVYERSSALVKSFIPLPVFKLNLVLTVLAVAALLSYVFLSNFLVSQRYILGMRKHQFNQVSASQLPDESANGNRVYGIKDLLFFAQTSGMIEAKDISVVLEEAEVVISGAKVPQGQ